MPNTQDTTDPSAIGTPGFFPVTPDPTQQSQSGAPTPGFFPVDAPPQSAAQSSATPGFFPTTSPTPSTTSDSAQDPNEGLIGKTWDRINKPLVNIRDIAGTDPNEHPILASVEDFGSGLSSPLSLALTLGTLGTAGLAEGAGASLIRSAVGEELAPQVVKGAGVVAKLLNTGFTINQIHDVAKSLPTFADALTEGDYVTAERVGTTALLGGLTAGLSAAHGISRFAEPEVFNGVNRAIGEQDAVHGSAAIDIRDFVKTHQELLENKPLDAAAFLYGEAGGDLAKLDAQKFKVAVSDASEATKAKWIERYDLAKNLPQDIRDKIPAIDSDYADDHQTGQKLGMFDKDKPRNDNYFGQRVYELQDGQQTEGGSTKKPGFTKQRIYSTVADAIANGETPKDIGLIASRADYMNRFAKAEGIVRAENSLTSQAAEDSRPLAVDPAKVRTMDGAKVIPLPNGVNPHELGDSLVTGKDGKLYVDVTDYKPGPDVFQKTRVRGIAYDEELNQKPIFDRATLLVHPDALKQVNEVFGSQQGFQSKPLNAALAVNTAAKKSLLSVSPFHWVTEALRGAQMGLNPFDIFSPKAIENSDLAVTKGLPHGLTLNSLEHKSFVDEGLDSGGLVSKVPVVGNAFKWAEDKLFQQYIPRLKSIAYEKAVSTMRDYNPDMGDTELYSKAAKQVNAAFGGLNWRQLGVAPQTRDIMRLFMLAPDFTGSQILFGKYAMEKGGSPVTTSLARIMAYNVLAAQAVNLMTTGKVQPGHPFSVVGQDGKSLYSVRTMPADIAHAVVNPREFFENRLSPIARAGIQTVTGRDETGRYMTGEQEVANLLRNVVPITLQGLAPDSPTSAGESAMKGVGIGKYDNMTNAENMAKGYLREQASQAPRVPGSTQKYKMLDGLTQQFRDGQIDDSNLQAGVRAGQISDSEMKTIKTNGRLSELGAMANKLQGTGGLQKVLEIYNAATLPEKKDLDAVLDHKIQEYRKSLTGKNPPSAEEQGYMNYLISRRGLAKPPEAPGPSSSLFTPSSVQAASRPRISIDDFARAVAKAEGAKPALNNPGDLKDSSGQIAQFGSMEEGERKLRGQLRAMITGKSNYYTPDMSLKQAGLIYSDNDPNWSKNVARELGVSEETKLADLIP